MIGRALLLVLLVGTLPLFAQGMDPREEMKKRMTEIARLMRDSERALLDISRLGRLLEEQQEIVRKLKELDQPPPETEVEAAMREHAEQQEKLRRQQEEITQRIRRLFDDQKKSAGETSRQIEALLRSLPQGQGQGEGDPNQPQPGKQPSPEEQRRLDEQRKKEREQRGEEPKGGEENKEPQSEAQPGSGEKPPSDPESAAQQRRIQAWMARLPPEIQERLNRNDYSAIPSRYQRLVREITALRAKRESEETPER